MVPGRFPPSSFARPTTELGRRGERWISWSGAMRSSRRTAAGSTTRTASSSRWWTRRETARRRWTGWRTRSGATAASGCGDGAIPASCRSPRPAAATRPCSASCPRWRPRRSSTTGSVTTAASPSRTPCAGRSRTPPVATSRRRRISTGASCTAWRRRPPSPSAWDSSRRRCGRGWSTTATTSTGAGSIRTGCTRRSACRDST